jgi:hypothetical protein
LTIKVLFKLPLRQTTGMVASLLKMADLDWAVPDYTTLCRRQKTLSKRAGLARLISLTIFSPALVRLPHVPLLLGYDEPRILSYPIRLFRPTSTDIRQLWPTASVTNGAADMWVGGSESESSS